MKRKIRVLIVDDHAMMRLGLAEAIAGERDLTLVGEAGSGEQCLEQYRQHEPDVVTMDFRLPGADGAESIARLRAALPGGMPIQVDGGIGDDTIVAARDAGATLLVAGSAIFGGDDLADAYRRLAQAVA